MEAERNEQSIKAFEQDSIKGGVVCKQIVDFLFKGNNLVYGTTISKMSADHDEEEVSHASSEYQTLSGDKIVTSKDFELDHVLRFII